MAPNIDEYLVFLRDNASEIKSLGKQWGMDEEEIVSCVNEVLSRSTNIENKGNTPLNLARKVWRTFLFFMKLSMCVTLVLIVAGTAIAYHSPTADYVSRAIQPHAYPVMRFFRLTALPFHDVANITGLYDADCLVDNPFYVGESIDCRPCSVFKRIKEAEADSFPQAKLAAYVHADKPVLLKKTYGHNVTYADLRKVYLDNKVMFDGDFSEFVSNEPDIPSVRELFGDDKEASLLSLDNLQIRWKLMSVPTTVAMRDLFPRPSFVPERAEIILEKHILIDSPKSGTYQMEEMRGVARLYTQAHGRRRILLRPVEDCKSECSSLLVIMEAGDSLVYSDGLYNMFMSANQDDLSIGYVMQFMV